MRATIINALFRSRLETPWNSTFRQMVGQSLLAAAINFGVGALVLGSAWLFFIELSWHPAWNYSQVMLRYNDESIGVLLGVIAAVALAAGFAAEIAFLRHIFGKQELTIRTAVALNLDSLQGSWWSAIWRAILATAAIILIEVPMKLVLPSATGPAEEFLLTLPPLGFFVVGLVAIFAAPIVEEVMFRGFFLLSCRCSFRTGRFTRWLKSELAVDAAAIIVSAVFFAALHGSLSAFPYLLVTAVILGVLFRQSGTLIAPIIAHMLNNALGVVLLWLSR
ncbi:hypothetical protein BH10CYA1_BH10CYA1_32040 [soil metagenome]